MKRLRCLEILPAIAMAARAQDATVDRNPPEQNWHWHVQNTDIVQGYPGFSAKYSGPNSLHAGGEVRETVSLDLIAGVRLWGGAEAHVETYYDFQIWKTVHASMDYQFVSDSAFNRDRGPVHVFGARLHWEF